MIFNKITDAIGNTPLLKINREVHGIENLNLYVKLEYLNPFGSIKDRIAWNIIKGNIKNIKKENKTIVESSSGNTAKAIQAIASSNDIEFKTITNRIKVDEQKDILLALGAKIKELPGASECPDPNDPDDPLTYIDNLMKDEGHKYFRTGQYTNEKNNEIHRKNTGSEIKQELKKVDYFFGGLGTTGSTKGITQALKESNPNIKTIGVVSTSDDFIPGIRTENEMWEVGLFDKNLYHDILKVSSKDAVKSTIKLIRESGILSGPTTGSQLSAIQKFFSDKNLKEEKNAVFLACDRIQPYISYMKKRCPSIFGLKQQNKNKTTSIDIEAEQINCDELEKNLNNYLVVDIRSNPAYKASHIKNSINIPSDYIGEMIRVGNPFPDKKTVIVCPTGEKSLSIASKILQIGGDAFSLKGGIIRWRDLGKNLESTLN